MRFEVTERIKFIGLVIVAKPFFVTSDFVCEIFINHNYIVGIYLLVSVAKALHEILFNL